MFRFNGETAERIALRDENGLSDRDNIVQSQMIEDKQGKLWFSTYRSLYCYDPVLDRMSSHQIEANGLMVERDYRPFYFDEPRNELWFRAGDRLWAYNVAKKSHRPLTEKSTATQYTVLPLPHGEYRITGARWILPGLELMKINPDGVPARVVEATPEEKVICSLQLNADSIILGTKNGLKLLDLGQDSFAANNFVSDKRELNVTNMQRITSKDLLVSYANKGLVRFNLATDLKTDLPEYIQSKGPHSPDQLLQGPDGQILLTQINHGIQLFSQETPVFQQRLQATTSPVAGIIKNSKNTRYVLTENGHLWQKDVSGEWSDLFINLAEDQLPKMGAITISNDSVFVAGVNNFWVLTDSDQKRFEKPNTILSKIMVHPLGGHLLITERGLSIFGFRDEKLTLIPHPKAKVPDDSFFSDFYPLSDTSFFLNLQPSELWKKFISQAGYEHTEKINNIGEIYCATEHSSGTVYAGGSQGLFRLQDGQGQRIPLEAGQLDAPQIQAIAEDGVGNLWLGTTDGLLAWHPDGEVVIYFGEADGLPSARFTDVAPITLPDGEIWMATDAGLVAFQPEELLKLQHHREPYIANIWTNEEPLQSDTSSHYLKRLEVNYLRNTLKFKVAAKGFGRSAASGIRYQMLGYEDQPAYTDFNTTIRYPNLPPGDYTLQLTAINQNGLPSGVRELAVIIRPPFTQTLTFKLLAGLGLILLVGGGYAILLRRERQRQQRIQEQQARLAAERDRIAGEVHDDLGGQLSSIMYLSEELLLTEAAPGTERELGRINELSRNSLQNVRDIIFALDNRRGTVADLGEQLRGSGKEFFADHHLQFAYDEKLEKPEAVLSSRQKRNLLLITKEAWHNSVKHARATTITLHYRQMNEALSVIISDDGRGFNNPASASATGGYGLDNMREKAASIGGTLTIDSGPGRGTTLTLSVPISWDG